MPVNKSTLWFSDLKQNCKGKDCILHMGNLSIWLFVSLMYPLALIFSLMLFYSESARAEMVFWIIKCVNNCTKIY